MARRTIHTCDLCERELLALRETLPEPVQAALDAAFYAWLDVVDKALGPLDDATVESYGRGTDSSVEDVHAASLVLETWAARREVSTRRVLAKVRKFCETNPDGAYCVEHDGDLRECWNRHEPL